MTGTHRPIWFDIDGTLVHTKVGKAAFQRALQETYGWEDSLEEVRFAGNTDLKVLMDFSERFSGDRTTALERKDEFFMRLASFLDEGLSNERPEAISGAKHLLDSLSHIEEIGMYLLTGNARDCAFHKLRHAGLHEPFSEGGFGDEHADRNVLAEKSRERLREQMKNHQLHEGWVIGDTPRDVQAAQTIGAKAVGVASGAYTADQLLKAGAAVVVEDLNGAAELIELVLS